MERSAFSVEEIAERAGISRAKLYELLREGAGPDCFFVGRRRLVSLDAERRWHASLEEKARARKSEQRCNAVP